jgi:hypothetical protein
VLLLDRKNDREIITLNHSMFRIKIDSCFIHFGSSLGSFSRDQCYTQTMRAEIQIFRAACETLIRLDGLTAEEREAAASCARELEREVLSSYCYQHYVKPASNPVESTMRPEVLEFMRACEKLIGDGLTNEECEAVASAITQKLETKVYPICLS